MIQSHPSWSPLSFDTRPGSSKKYLSSTVLLLEGAHSASAKSLKTRRHSWCSGSNSSVGPGVIGTGDCHGQTYLERSCQKATSWICSCLSAADRLKHQRCSGWQQPHASHLCSGLGGRAHCCVVTRFLMVAEFWRQTHLVVPFYYLSALEDSKFKFTNFN